MKFTHNYTPEFENISVMELHTITLLFGTVFTTIILMGSQNIGRDTSHFHVIDNGVDRKELLRLLLICC